jgi:stage II sporulation protein D
MRPGAIRSILLPLVACFWLCTGAGAQPKVVSVNLFEAFPPARRIFVEGPFELRLPFKRGWSVGLCEAVTESGQIVLRPVRPAERDRIVTAKRFILTGLGRHGLALRHHAGMAKRHYRGVVELSVNPDGTMRIRNQLPIMEYVVSVVGSETFPGWANEALKAQAVLTQTRLFRYKADDELGDTTQQEAYLGSDYDRPDVRSAVQTVWGQMLAYDHRPIQPFYHSTCAGRISAGDQMFGKKAKNMVYLESKDCTFCKDSPFMKVTRSVIHRKQFSRVFGPGLPRVGTVDSAGRPLEIALGNGNRMRGYDFWIKLGKNFGWDKAPGTRFNFAEAVDGSIELSSTGAGHGVGMCQWGAAGQARLGKSYREILKYYFPGTDIN